MKLPYEILKPKSKKFKRLYDENKSPYLCPQSSFPRVITITI